jgi:histidine triad (HIT) family protein
MVAQLNGRAAGQTVFHYHVHIIPRQEGEPLALHAAKPGNMEEIKALGERIAAEIEEVA